MVLAWNHFLLLKLLSLPSGPSISRTCFIDVESQVLHKWGLQGCNSHHAAGNDRSLYVCVKGRSTRWDSWFPLCVQTFKDRRYVLFWQMHECYILEKCLLKLSVQNLGNWGIFVWAFLMTVVITGVSIHLPLYTYGVNTVEPPGIVFFSFLITVPTLVIKW